MNLDKIKTLAIIGDRNTGKTNLAFHLLRKYKGSRTIVLYAYPETIKGKDGNDIAQINTLQELSMTKDSIIFMDELQNHIKFYNTKTSMEFFDLLSVMAHNNNTLIFSTPMSQYITKAFDCFIDGIIYTRLSDLGTLKNGSKAKRRLHEFSNPNISPWSVSLEVGEYLQIVDYGFADDNGFHKFEFEQIGKSWRKK